MDEDQATIPHMNAMDVPFQMHYGGLIWTKGLQSDRLKYSASVVDPGAFQNMTIKYLSVGLYS